MSGVVDEDETVEVTAATATHAGAASGRHAPLHAGELVDGRYVILDDIGAGGGGSVFSAFDTKLDRKVALKVLHAAGPAAQEALVLEAQAMAKLSHPNVVAVYDVGTIDDSRMFMTMALVEGGTLRAWSGANHPWRETLELYLQAGRGLAAAHATGIIHRDFKPANVLVTRSGQALVTDFGIAKLGEVDDDDSDGESAGHGHDQGKTGGSGSSPVQGTQHGSIRGTPNFLAPERWAGQPSDARSDQFAFAVALYDALFGEHPFDRKLPFSDPDRWRIREPDDDHDVPGWLHRAVCRGLHADPVRRYESVDDMLEALAAEPWSRRRVAGVAAMVIGGVIAAVAIQHSLPSSRASGPVCQVSDDAFAGVWDADVRRRVRDAFVATGAPQAEQMFARVSDVFDDYSERWLAQSQDACEATRIHGTQSDEALTLRSTCLGRAKDQMQTLVSVFSEPTKTTVAGSVSAAYQLSDLAMCKDLVSLRSPVPLPPEQREPADAIRHDLDRAWSLYSSGQRNEGVDLADATRAEAMELGYAPLHAQASLLLGRMKSAIADTDAEAALLDAIYTGQIAHDLETQFAAASELAVLYHNLREMPKAELVEGLAQSYYAALGKPQRLATEQLWLEATSALIEKDLDVALKTLKEVVEVDQRHGAPNPVFTARVYNQLGRLLATVDLDGGLEASRRALELREHIFGPSSPEVAISAMNLGDQYRKAERCEEALPQVVRADEIVEKLEEPMELLHWYTIVNRAATQACVGQFAGVIDDLEGVVTAAGAAGHQIGPTAEYELSLVLLNTGRTEEALAAAQNALEEMLARLSDGDPEMALYHCRVGRVQLSLGDFAGAKKSFVKALSYPAAEVHVTIRGRAHFGLAQVFEHEQAPDQMREHLAQAQTLADENRLPILAAALAAHADAQVAVDR